MMTKKNPTLIRTRGSFECRRASRYAAEPMAVVLTYIWACDESTNTGEEVIICSSPQGAFCGGGGEGDARIISGISYCYRGENNDARCFNIDP